MSKFQAIPSLHSLANARKPLRTDGQTDGRTDRRTDGHAVKQLRLVRWTNGPMYRSKEGISSFAWTDGRTDGRADGRTEGRTDGQPENIMPQAPKGGGIKIIRLNPSIILRITKNIPLADEINLMEDTCLNNSYNYIFVSKYDDYY